MDWEVSCYRFWRGSEVSKSLYAATLKAYEAELTAFLQHLQMQTF